MFYFLHNNQFDFYQIFNLKYDIVNILSDPLLTIFRIIFLVLFKVIFCNKIHRMAQPSINPFYSRCIFVSIFISQISFCLAELFDYSVIQLHSWSSPSTFCCCAAAAAALTTMHDRATDSNNLEMEWNRFVLIFVRNKIEFSNSLTFQSPVHNVQNHGPRTCKLDS